MIKIIKYNKVSGGRILIMCCVLLLTTTRITNTINTVFEGIGTKGEFANIKFTNNECHLFSKIKITFLPWFSRVKHNEDFYAEERCQNDVGKYNQINLV